MLLNNGPYNFLMELPILHGVSNRYKYGYVDQMASIRLCLVIIREYVGLALISQFVSHDMFYNYYIITYFDYYRIYTYIHVPYIVVSYDLPVFSLATWFVGNKGCLEHKV